MKAMILAAGLGTRLRPLTDRMPKALVPIHRVPALEWGIRRLHHIGVESIIINTHYLAEQVEAFVKQRQASIPELTLSFESEILGTGGGILPTQSFWGEQPFLLHNVDIFSSVDLLAAYQQHQHYHQEQQGLATLLTQNRVTQTKLLIDEGNFLCGIHYYKTGNYRLVRTPQGKLQEHGFTGIHMISPKIFPWIKETGTFSIIDCYLRLTAEGKPIRTFDIGNAYWKDIGTPEKLAELEQDWQNHPCLRKCYET